MKELEQMKPVTCIDWEKVTHVQVTLEAPHKGGGLRWRQGRTNAKKNLSYNAHDTESGPPWWPGTPIMFPEDAPAIAGDADRESFNMPVQDAFTAFGHFFAPLEVPKNGVVGFTMSTERERVAMFWGWYKLPPGDGTMHPPMNRVGPPEMPRVAIRPLGKNFKPMKVEGDELVIRPYDFFDFGNPNNYDRSFDKTDTNELAMKLANSGFTSDEVESLREMLKVKNAKRPTG